MEGYRWPIDDVFKNTLTCIFCICLCVCVVNNLPHPRAAAQAKAVSGVLLLATRARKPGYFWLSEHGYRIVAVSRRSGGASVVANRLWC